jgi:hypothetical protein
MHMAAADRVGLVMDVARLQMRMQVDLVGAGQSDVEYLGLFMIDPDDRVEVGLHDCSFGIVGNSKPA